MPADFPPANIPTGGARPAPALPLDPLAAAAPQAGPAGDAPDACVLYLVRHGATLYNTALPARLQGSSIDAPLSDEGRWQAERTAEHLRPLPFAAVYSSTLLRARQTAAVLAAPRQLTPQERRDLVEINVGRWEGLCWAEIRERDPEAHRLFRLDPERHGYPGGENLRQVADRVRAAIDELLERHLGQTILVVSHGLAIRACLTTLLGLPAGHADLLAQDNCGVNILRRHENHTRVLTMNAAMHCRRW